MKRRLVVPWIGGWLIAVGVIHTLFGLLFMRSTLAILWSEGLFNTVNGQPAREGVFWFLYTGVLFLIAGVLIDQIERRHLAIPGFVSWAFAVVTVIGVFVMPISGIWLLLPPVVGLLIRWRQSGRADEA